MDSRNKDSNLIFYLILGILLLGFLTFILSYLSYNRLDRIPNVGSAISVLQAQMEPGYLPVGNSPEALTLRLLILSKAYSDAASNRKPLIFSRMLEISESRKQNLLLLMEENPSVFLKVTIPKHIKGEFPSEITSNIEDEVEVEGSLDVLHSDNFDKGLSKFYYFLKDASGNRFSLHFVGEGPMLLTGSRIRVKGMKLADKIAVESAGKGNVDVLYSAPTGHTIKKLL